MLVIGIDPGLKGGVALLGRANPEVWPTPIIKAVKGSVYDETEMFNLLDTMPIPLQDLHAFIEQTQAMPIIGRKVDECPVCHRRPAAGATSSHKIGLGEGIWRGLLGGLRIPYTRVSPRTWQRLMLAGVGQDGMGTKKRSIIRAKQLFPEVSLKPGRCRVDQDGLADALLVADYGRRTLLGAERAGSTAEVLAI